MQSMTIVLGMGKGRKKVEVTGMFYDGRNAVSCNGYPHRYAMRDNGCGQFSSLEESACVNFAGYLFFKEKVDLGKEEWLPIREWWFTN